MFAFKLRLTIFAFVAFVLVVCSQVAGAREWSPQNTDDDQLIVSNIQARLFNDSVLKSLDIRVFCQDGVVTLAGSVDTELEKAAVERIAKQEHGVTSVVNNLTVLKSSGAAADTSNAAPTPDSTASPNNGASDAGNATSDASTAPEGPVTLPSGTPLTVRMIDEVDSATTKVGDTFHASLENALVVGDVVVAPKGADVYGKLVRVDPNGKIAGAGKLTLELTGIHVRGQLVVIDSETFEVVGKGRGKQTAEAVGGGAAAGATIGGIAGGGAGAAIGAAAGAGGATIVQLVRHRDHLRIPSETLLEFKLQQAVNIPAAAPAPAPAAPAGAPPAPAEPAGSSGPKPVTPPPADAPPAAPPPEPHRL